MRSPLVATAGLALAVLAAVMTATRARAAPGHDWSYPYCGEQPVISAVYDHEYPTYGCSPNGNGACDGDNGLIRLYNNDTARGRFGYEGHNGWDYTRRAADGGNKRRVYAVANGTVTYAGWHHPGAGECGVSDHERGYGLMLRVSHGGEEALYGHLSAIHVRAGESVGRGQIIATMGSSGNSTGPHLHFGAFRPSGPDLYHSFDPYGWNADWRGEKHAPLPRELDPWYQHSGQESVRRILPGAPDGETCPVTCGASVVVDDGDPGFQLGCGAGGACPHWYAASQGNDGDLMYTYPNGLAADYWARWTAPLPAGTYEVEAYVPLSRHYGTSHAARYRIQGRDVVVDQHEEGNVWVKLGIYNFGGAPSVELTDATFIEGNYSYSGTCRTLAADAVRFTPICGGYGAGGGD